MDAIAHTALKGETGVYLVGGAVRDALLGRPPRELDFVVEGDAIALARRAAERVGGALTVHDRFGTATVYAGDHAFDLVSARTERYPEPGALPEVTLGATIEQDLARRDFTINAIAESLDGDRVEWPGATEDLRNGVLRVLHDRSFIDDPTRMLRLTRYAARLGFAPDAHTRALIDPALYRTVSADRIHREVRLLLDEAPHRLAELPDLLGAEDLLPPEIIHALRLHDRLDGSDADLWRRLRRERLEPIEVLAAAGNANARRWLDEIRHKRLQITGHDLIERGLTGAAVGDGLTRATVAMLDGDAPDRESQLAAALDNGGA